MAKHAFLEVNEDCNKTRNIFLFPQCPILMKAVPEQLESAGSEDSRHTKNDFFSTWESFSLNVKHYRIHNIYLIIIHSIF